MSNALIPLLFLGCLVNDSLYLQRRAALLDEDGDGWSDEEGDCNDRDPSISPDAIEICNEIDDNCNGLIDDSPPGNPWYVDADSDSFGGTEFINACEPPTGHVAQQGDCDDADPLRNPGATEKCDDAETDEDCDGLSDDLDPEGATGSQSWYIDADSDGHGSPSYTVTSCEQPSGYVESADDCNDLVSTVNPSQVEECGNRLDDDCDSTANDCRLIGETNLLTIDWALPGNYGHVLGSGVAMLPDDDGDGVGSLLVTLSSHYSEWHTGVMSISTKSGGNDLNLATGEIQQFDEIDRPFERLTVIGDSDGDGQKEFLVSCPDCFDEAGAVFQFSLPIAGTMTIADATRTYQGFSSGDALGFRLVALGDLNIDGFSDAVITAYGSDSRAPNAGAAWLLWGSDEGLPDHLDEPTWTGVQAGDSLAAAAGGRDLDGDGLLDIALGAPGRAGLGTFRGGTYVLLGPEHERSLDDADGLIVGTSDSSYSGINLLLTPDISGDGLDDLSIGTTGDRTCTDEAGGIAIFAGPATVFGVMSDADACLRADERGDEGGWSIDSAGDVDGNGMVDLVIGAPQARDGRGMAWLIYTPVRGSQSLSTVGASFVGIAPGDRAGWSLAGGTDVNGDSVPDLAIGSKLETTSPTTAGAVYLVFGTGL